MAPKIILQFSVALLFSISLTSQSDDTFSEVHNERINIPELKVDGIVKPKPREYTGDRPDSGGQDSASSLSTREQNAYLELISSLYEDLSNLRSEMEQQDAENKAEIEAIKTKMAVVSKKAASMEQQMKSQQDIGFICSGVGFAGATVAVGTLSLLTGGVGTVAGVAVASGAAFGSVTICKSLFR